MNLGRFIIFQVSKEADTGTLSTLVALNTGSLSYGLSYIIVQQPLCLLSSWVMTVPPYNAYKTVIHTMNHTATETFFFSLLGYEAFLFLSLFISQFFDKLVYA